MKILVASSEVTPLAKTGGLADVASALPMALRQLRHDVRIVLPRYRCVDRRRYRLRAVTPTFPVHLGHQRKRVQLFATRLPGTTIIVYCVEHGPSFLRAGLYQQRNGRDHADNLERFTLLNRAILAGFPLVGWVPDVIHANDWQTGLLATYLAATPHAETVWSRTAVVFTVHNLAYQGTFPRVKLPVLNLPTRARITQRVVHRGQVNLLHAGLSAGRQLTTVSPTYAREIQTRALGRGLHTVLRRRRRQLHGILNGIDDVTWNPATDRWIPARFTARCLDGKRRCKRALQRAFKLPLDPATPLCGVVTRLAAQKGVDVLTEALQHMLVHQADRPLQCVILGTGDHAYYRQLQHVQRQFPQQLAVRYAFDDRVAHLIEAGADIFLMPSRYEPCGLNQMYSQRYGTVPIVSHTGGLADTVVHASPQALRDGRATGFVFAPVTATAFESAMQQAFLLYADTPRWERVMRTGMRQDFSWTRAARRYVQVYRQAMGADLARSRSVTMLTPTKT